MLEAIIDQLRVSFPRLTFSKHGVVGSYFYLITHISTTVGQLKLVDHSLLHVWGQADLPLHIKPAQVQSLGLIDLAKPDSIHTLNDFITQICKKLRPSMSGTDMYEAITTDFFAMLEEKHLQPRWVSAHDRFFYADDGEYVIEVPLNQNGEFTIAQIGLTEDISQIFISLIKGDYDGYTADTTTKHFELNDPNCFKNIIKLINRRK